MTYVGSSTHLFESLQKIEERESLVQQRIEYETSTKDPDRFKPKGSQQEKREQRRR